MPGPSNALEVSSSATDPTLQGLSRKVTGVGTGRGGGGLLLYSVFRWLGIFTVFGSRRQGAVGLCLHGCFYNLWVLFVVSL